MFRTTICSEQGACSSSCCHTTWNRKWSLQKFWLGKRISFLTIHSYKINYDRFSSHSSYFQGASFSFSWKASAKRSLYKAIFGSVSCLDRWHLFSAFCCNLMLKYICTFFFNIDISCFALIEFDLDITVRRNVLTIYSLCFEIDFFFSNASEMRIII